MKLDEMYDIWQIKADYNSRLSAIKKAIDEERIDILEGLLIVPLYDDVDDIPKIKHRYQVTLKRVMTRTIEVEATDEDDAVATATEQCGGPCTIDWVWDDDLEPDVELLED